MRYTKEERLEIGRKVYEGIMTRYEAAEATASATTRQEII